MNKVTALLQSFTRWVVPRNESFVIKGLVLLFLFGLFLFPIGIAAQTTVSSSSTAL